MIVARCSSRRACVLVAVVSSVVAIGIVIATYPTSGTEAASGSGYQSLSPGRLLDSRADGETIDGQFAKIGARNAGSTTELQVGGRGGVASNADSAVLNVTVTEAQGPGFVTVWPCGTTRPNASSLNYSVGSTIANAVIAKIGTDGKVCLFVSNTTHLIADVNGYSTSEQNTTTTSSSTSTIPATSTTAPPTSGLPAGFEADTVLGNDPTDYCNALITWTAAAPAGYQHVTAHITLYSSAAPWPGFHLESHSTDPWVQVNPDKSVVIVNGTSHSLPVDNDILASIGDVYLAEFTSAKMELTFSGAGLSDVTGTVWSKGYWTSLGAC